MKADILGLKIDKIIMTETLVKAGEFLLSNKRYYIVTLNAEMIVAAQKDAEFKHIINNADLVVADGVGPIFASAFLKRKAKSNYIFLNYIYNLFLAVFLGLSLVFYSKFCRRELPERIAGVDLMLKIINKFQNGAIKFFLLGAKEGVAKTAASRLKQKFSDIEIVGTFSGGGKEKGDRIAISIINQAKPDVLFVAYGAPKQEKWIARNMDKLPSVKIAIGVGGAFDMISGKIKRAPKRMRDMGLEWLWRLAMEPRRIGRIYSATIKFIWLLMTK